MNKQQANDHIKAIEALLKQYDKWLKINNFDLLKININQRGFCQLCLTASPKCETCVWDLYAIINDLRTNSIYGPCVTNDRDNYNIIYKSSRYCSSITKMRKAIKLRKIMLKKALKLFKNKWSKIK